MEKNQLTEVSIMSKPVNCILCDNRYFETKELMIEHANIFHKLKAGISFIWDLKLEEYIGLTDIKHEGEFSLMERIPNQDAMNRFDRKLI